MATKILGKVAMTPKGVWTTGIYNKYDYIYDTTVNGTYLALKDGVTTEPSGNGDGINWTILCRGIGTTTDNNFTDAEKAKVDAAILSTQINIANGYVGIGSDGKINNSEFSNLKINRFHNIIKGSTKGIIVGDSIAVGYNATGAGESYPSGRIIFSNGTDTCYEGNYTSNCWVNYFRRYCTKENTSIDIINAGIAGTTARYANINKTYRLPDSSYDFIIIELGTNDFGMGYTADDFKQNYQQFVEYAKTKSKVIICISPIPRIDAVTNSSFTVAQCETMIEDIAYQENCFFIPLFNMWVNYFNTSGLDISNYLTIEGLHPNDMGHLLFWNILQTTFQFTDSQSMYNLHSENYTNGIWTPIISGSTTAGSPTYSSQIGKYYKIGKMVFCTGQLQISAKGGMVGDVNIGGLPLPISTNQIDTAVKTGFYNNAALTSGCINGGLLSTNSAKIMLLKGTTTGALNVSASEITDTFGIFDIEFNYLTT